MTILAWALDVAVVLLLLGLALRVLTTRDLFEATVLFVAYGLTLALAWARLGAPDVALAEAALGAGVTGAILLNAFQRLARRADAGDTADSPDPSRGSARVPSGEPDRSHPLLVDDRSHDGARWIRGLLAAGAAAFAGGLVLLLLGLPEHPPLLPALVEGSREVSGISNPVNAVLLGFRGWDTLLEVTVLVAAAVTVWSLDRGTRPLARAPGDRTADPVLHGLARLVVPLAATTAIYLVWAGSERPGGAFQAGALMAGAGVLLVARGFVPAFSAASLPVRGAAASGLLAFIGAGVAGMTRTGAFLAYPEAWAYPLLLGVEAVMAVTVTLILVELFVDVPAVPERDPALERVHPTGDPLGRMLTRALDPEAEGAEG